MRKVLKKLQHYYSPLGWKGVAMFLMAKLTNTMPLYKISLPGLRHPVFIRIGSTDLSVLKQVLIERHYEFKLPVVPKVIVDGGANIGLSAVYFANKYPGAVIIAAEPEESNYELLLRNVSLYPEIKPLKAAIWNQDKQICLLNPDSANHGFQTGDAGGGDSQLTSTVEGRSLDSLMTQMGLERIDILKLDIEGAEFEVLQTATKWIGKVAVIMIELHDHLKAGCRQEFLEATADFDHEQCNGETVARYRTMSLKIQADGSPQQQSHLTRPVSFFSAGEAGKN